MIKLLNPGGHLLVTFPYCESEHVENVYDLDGSSYGKNATYKTRAYCRSDLDRWFKAGESTIVDQEYWRYWDCKFWTVGNQILPPEKSSVQGLHQHTCLHVQKAK
ncbi:hypothetical protein CA13_26120 [Planctomycetes bacterium CA13]|uniref:Methyltransferase type 11 domain-containing protein n=1 Tax=Novipirellula herctigrandis TaxID=2527986 RepID=A0A5C5Z1H8_9BACT|nr:hypothetical protein CA13_26120 [Planctomycetes bacterium CA13]